ncbi:MnhB domain-containing protein, partial [Salmonella enterica]|uniref:MnhB domain-containing protein n=1 Tax=Salmonella enterica TaxID=28901 RepID=UPI000CB2B89F
VIYPFIVLISFYMMFNGHNTPGGGFQGGTILATVLISRYLVHPNLDVNLDLLERAEMILFACIVLTPVLYLFIGLQPENTVISHEIYMILMNTLIGLKVFCGLSVIFYRFVFYVGSEDKN